MIITKMLFSAAAAEQPRPMKEMGYDRYWELVVNSGIGDENGNPTELAYFLDRLYGPCLENFFLRQRGLLRMIAAGKTIWEAQKRFPGKVYLTCICAIGAIIAKGSIHRRKCVADMGPFFSSHMMSDLLDEAAELMRTTNDLKGIPDGKKNELLSERGIDPTQFRVVRAEWRRMKEIVGGAPGTDDYTGIVGEEAILRCAILAGTHWTNSFDRDSILQDISICSVLNGRRFDIMGSGPKHEVIVGWNFPMTAEDALYDMLSEGYPLTLVTRREIEQFAPDLLELPFVREQLSGSKAPVS